MTGPSLATESFEVCRDPQSQQPLEVLRWPGLTALGVDAVVTTRAGGVSSGPYESLNLGLHVGDDPTAVVENRRRAAAGLGASLGQVVFSVQVHGDHAAVVGPADAGRGAYGQDDAVPATDCLVTSSTDLVLATLVADCSPILLVDPDAPVLATVHAGWRGALGGVGRAAVDAMASLGARPARVHAVIGPTIAFDRYEVGRDVADAATAAFGPDVTTVLVAHRDRWRFDVAGANERVLIAAGLAPSHIYRTTWSSNDTRFFSDRAERPCGRFALLARLLPPGERP